MNFLRQATAGCHVRDFSASEGRVLAVYAAGLMLYKFGLEAFAGSAMALAADRYDGENDSTTLLPAQRVALLTGLNHALQLFGAVAAPPLVGRFPVGKVLAVAVVGFAVFAAIPLAMDVATGGRAVAPYGRFATDGLIPVYGLCAVMNGALELVRRVVTPSLVQGGEEKLRRTNALVHMLYEVAGVAGALCTGLFLVPTLGLSRASAVTPICFSLAGVAWYFMRVESSPIPTKETDVPDVEAIQTPDENPHMGFVNATRLTGSSMLVGARTVLTDRSFVWLVPCYAVALYAHRFLEDTVAVQVAHRNLGHGAWAPIIVAGSNAGELLGAAAVFLTAGNVPTPVPWVRLGAALLLVVWTLPYWTPASGDIAQAWSAAAILSPIGFGWAAADVSLTAHVQAKAGALGNLRTRAGDVSVLAAVMAFLYAAYSVLEGVVAPMLVLYFADDSTMVPSSNGGTIDEAFVNAVGIHLTLVVCLVFAASFIPRNSSPFNPRALHGPDDDEEEDVRWEHLEGQGPPTRGRAGRKL